MTVQPEVMSPPPPGWTVARWARVVTACRSMDYQYQYGAPTKETREIWPEHLNRTGVLFSVGTENEAVRACVNTPDPANPDVPGADNDER